MIHERVVPGRPIGSARSRRKGLERHFRDIKIGGEGKDPGRRELGLQKALGAGLASKDRSLDADPWRGRERRS